MPNNNKVLKNYCVNMGSPFQVKNNLNFNTIKKIDLMELKEEEHLNDQNYNNIHNTKYLTILTTPTTKSEQHKT